MSVRAIVGHVFAVNVGLVVLAAATIMRGSIVVDMAALTVGAALVGWLLWRFAHRNA